MFRLFFDFLMLLPGKIQRWLFIVGLLMLFGVENFPGWLTQEARSHWAGLGWQRVPGVVCLRGLLLILSVSLHFSPGSLGVNVAASVLSLC